MPAPTLVTMTPEQALAAIDALEKFGIDLGLERVQACLSVLGDPHRRYPCVHVGGTNGKGSTASLLAAALSACGLRTGLFTSPPLEFFGERIRVDGTFLGGGAVAELYEAVIAAGLRDAAASGMTQFEVITAMAFLHFALTQVDVAVIEVGLGGRLDSTNVVLPEVAVITNVGLEHAEHLGGNTVAIAREKGGIVKPGVPLVTAAQGEALEALVVLAGDRGSPTHVLHRDFDAVPRGRGQIDYRGEQWRWNGVECPLRGPHQVDNLATALAALEVLSSKGWNLPESRIRIGLAGATWPGRLELCGSAPAVLLDGAHNPHASRVLAAALREEFEYRQLWLVLGILGDKDAHSILADLLPMAARVIVTAPATVRARTAASLAQIAQEFPGSLIEQSPSVAAAVDRALLEADPSDLICVTGSLTTVGEARGHLRRLGRVVGMVEIN
jgi:dihydrofolate synthase/folylpolyglutamate synthase